MKFDAKCPCGWVLPISVMPVRNVPDPHPEDDLVPDAIVCLVCPMCHRGHLFAAPHVAAKNPAMKTLVEK